MQKEEKTSTYLIAHCENGKERHWEGKSPEELQALIETELPEDHPVRRLWPQLRPGNLIILNSEEQITYSCTAAKPSPLSDTEILELVRGYAQGLDIYLARRRTLRRFLEEAEHRTGFGLKQIWADFLRGMPSPNQVRRGRPIYQQLCAQDIPSAGIGKIFAEDQQFLWRMGEVSCLLHSTSDYEAETKLLLRLRALILWLQVVYREIHDGHEAPTRTCNWLAPLPASERKQALLALAVGPFWEKISQGATGAETVELLIDLLPSLGEDPFLKRAVLYHLTRTTHY